MPGTPRGPAGKIAGMRSFDALVSEAEAADVTGWDFGWLDGRATENRPPWGYARMLAARLATARAALDIDTGCGEVVAEAPMLPARMCVTESWPPNAAPARALLAPRGVEVYETGEGEKLPFPDGAFDLVTSRHPVRPAWEEIHRVLMPGGHYVAQHVGPLPPSSSSSSSSAHCPSTVKAGTRGTRRTPQRGPASRSPS